MMTYLEHDVLPFPHVKGIDLGPAMKRKVVCFKSLEKLNYFYFYLIRILLKKKSFNMLMNFLFH